MNMPKVSVIVPIYNAEEFLYRCIDSLIYQTLEELEILLVDNKSEDDSFKIMKEYEKRFPNKVRCYQLEEHHDGPGAGRNLGLQYAEADYIGFADSDDYFEYDAFEKMYNKAISDECDLVYCSSYDVKGNKKRLTRKLPRGTKEEILTIGSMVFWNKLFHKSLFEENGEIPTDMVFEDMAYCSGVVSKAQKIGYINEPLYYYIIREDSGVNTLEPTRVLKELEAIDISLQKCAPDYIDVWTSSVAMRLCNNIRDRWQFTDAYIKKIKEKREYFEKNAYLKNDKRNSSRVKVYLNLPDDTIPKIVYTDIIVSQNKVPKYFYDEFELIELDVDMIHEKEDSFLLELSKSQNNELLYFYLALKKIYEAGGVYVHHSICMKNPLNCVIYNDAFFSYFDRENFSDKIFGAKRGNKYIKRMIELVEEMGIHAIPGNVMYQVLHIENKIPMNNKTDIYKYDVSVYGTPVFVFDDGAKMHIAEHSNSINKDEQWVDIKRSCLEFYLSNR